MSWKQSTSLTVFVAADAVFAVDLETVAIRKQPALGLRQMQADGGGFAPVREQLADVAHMGLRLMLRRELFEGDECSRQRFRDDPSVVAGDSLLRHQFT